MMARNADSVRAVMTFLMENADEQHGCTRAQMSEALGLTQPTITKILRKYPGFLPSKNSNWPEKWFFDANLVGDLDRALTESLRNRLEQMPHPVEKIEMTRTVNGVTKPLNESLAIDHEMISKMKNADSELVDLSIRSFGEKLAKWRDLPKEQLVRNLRTFAVYIEETD